MLRVTSRCEEMRCYAKTHEFRRERGDRSNGDAMGDGDVGDGDVGDGDGRCDGRCDELPFTAGQGLYGGTSDG